MYVKSDSVTEQDTSNQKEVGVPEGFSAVRVETGIITDDYVEIISGLSEGDEVYIEASSGTAQMNMFQMGGMPGGMQMGGMPIGSGSGRANGGDNRGGMPSGGMGGRP